MKEKYIVKSIPGGKANVFLRDNQFDTDIFKALVEQEEYQYIKYLKEPKVIVDAGANIGIASILFAIKFPEARIYAIEPEKNNYELMERNIAAYSNITPVMCALMGDNGIGAIRNPEGSSLGFQIDYNVENECEAVKCVSIDSFCKEYDIENINILKMDIEGAENDIFSKKGEWISKVDTLIIELHERFVKGCNKNVFSTIKGTFDYEWIGGENYYFTKKDKAEPKIPDIFKKENPLPLPIEMSWVYRDKFDEMYTAVCVEKDAELGKRDEAIKGLIAERDAKDAELGKRDEAIKGLIAERDAKDAELGKRDEAIKGLIAERDAKDAELGKRDEAIKGLIAERDAKNAELEQIYKTFIGKFLKGKDQ